MSGERVFYFMYSEEITGAKVLSPELLGTWKEQLEEESRRLSVALKIHTLSILKPQTNSEQTFGHIMSYCSFCR